MNAKKKVGQPAKPAYLKKKAICVALPQWIVEWTAKQSESRAYLIEEALRETYDMTIDNDPL